MTERYTRLVVFNAQVITHQCVHYNVIQERELTLLHQLAVSGCQCELTMPLRPVHSHFTLLYALCLHVAQQLLEVTYFLLEIRFLAFHRQDKSLIEEVIQIVICYGE